MHFILGILIFLYFALRQSTGFGRSYVRRSELYRLARMAFDDLVSQHGGNSYKAGWRKLIYVTPDRIIELQFHADSRRLIIRLRRAFAFPLAFYKLPRLVYAFIDAFLQPAMRVEGTHYLIGSRNSEVLSALRTRNGWTSTLQSLHRAGFSGQINQYGMKLWKRVDPDDLNDVTLMNFVRLAQDLSHLLDPEIISIPVQQLSSEKRCAYCKELLSELDPVQYCQFCGTPHHQECFQLNGKCTVYGCESPSVQQELTTSLQDRI